MARNAIRSAALSILATACAVPALAAGGSLRGEVMERERADGSRSLGVSIDREQIEALPSVARSFDELILTMPKAAARDLEVGSAPDGWRLDDSFRRGLRLYGPKLEYGDFRFDASRTWRPPSEVGLDCRLGGQSVFSEQLPVRHRPTVRLGNDYSEWLDLPLTLRVGSQLRLESLARDKYKLGLRWEFQSEDPYLDFGFRPDGRHLVGTVPDVYALGWNSHYDPLYPWRRQYAVIGRDRWNEVWVQDTWKPVFLPGIGLLPEPRFDGATEIVAPNSQLCICGETSDLSVWGGFSVGGVPLGEPIVATGTSAVFPVPQGLPPGQQPIEYDPWWDAGRGTGLGTHAIQVQGGIQKAVIGEREQTNLVLTVTGTDRSFPVTLENRSPQVIALHGADAEQKVHTQTSGGAANAVTHPVTGIEGTIEGNPFTVLYRVAMPSCPCDEEHEDEAETLGDEFVELLEGWNSELKGGSTGAPATKQELFDSVDRLWVNDRWRLNDRWSFNLGHRYDEVGSEAGTAAALPKPLADAGCRPGGEPLTLLNDRFKVEAKFQTVRDLRTSTPSPAAVCPQPDRNDSGLFFFDLENAAAMVKLYDGCGLNGRYWFLATTTQAVPIEYEVTDTANGETRRYEPPLDGFRPVLDTAAFATCP